LVFITYHTTLHLKRGHPNLNIIYYIFVQNQMGDTDVTKSSWSSTLDTAAAWSAGTTYATGDINKAKTWATAAGKFTCTLADATAGTPTTDCNTLLGTDTGGCCWTVSNATGPKAVPSKTSTAGKVVAELDAVWPILKDSTRYLCATEAGISGIQGFTAGTDTTPHTIDASMKFAAKDKKKTQLTGSVASWTCSGATALAVSGAAVTAFISLM
jgi:hypothetical protein